MKVARAATVDHKDCLDVKFWLQRLLLKHSRWKEVASEGGRGHGVGGAGNLERLAGARGKSGDGGRCWRKLVRQIGGRIGRYLGDQVGVRIDARDNGVLKEGWRASGGL